MTFNEFKASEPARSMFRKLGLLEVLETAQSWLSLRRMIVDFNDPDEGHFVKLARRCVCSSGERVLLHAILYVTDFAWLADELDAEDKSGTWQRFNRVSGDHRHCVAACIAAEVW
jgi:hypothetical protein